MKRKLLWVLGLTLVLAVVGLCGCGPRTTTVDNVQFSSQQTGIWVTGTGEVTATPDLATLRLGIAAEATTVAEAQSQAIDAMDKVMESLKDNGVDEKDIQTQYFNIRQVTEWDRIEEEEKVTGYRVTNMVTAKIREVDKAGTIIDAVAVAGGDFTRIDGISFSVDEPSAYYEEAREKAMADAKDKAENLAELGGVSLGKPTYISEGAAVPYTIYRDVTMEAAAPVPAPTPTPISPGEIEISLTIQVAYAIQ
jgi:uncharacterized protein YggE